MSWPYRAFIRPVLFMESAESIHQVTLKALGWAGQSEVLCEALASFYRAPELPVAAFGLRFPNPVGLAAGMDKDGEAVPAWAALGFGFTELGAVTWQAQPGNLLPRVFRAIAAGAIVNRFGFNNAGAEQLARRLGQWRVSGRWPRHPVGLNLGKSKVTPLDQAAADYAASFKALWPHADFFVVNVSSPNTPDLRQLQDKSALNEILLALEEVNTRMASQAKRMNSEAGNTHLAPGDPPRAAGEKPLLVKVAPDLSFEALDEILELVAPRRIAGLVATNTTLERPATADVVLKRVYAETGGLSGRPLRQRSTEIVRHLYRQTRGTLPIIGVGGVFDAADAWEKITAGACLVQLYTGLVFEGPGAVKAIVEGLGERLAAHGLRELREAVGLAASRPSAAAENCLAAPGPGIESHETSRNSSGHGARCDL